MSLVLGFWGDVMRRGLAVGEGGIERGGERERERDLGNRTG